MGADAVTTQHHRGGAIGGGEVGSCLTRIHHDRFTDAHAVADPVRERRAAIGFAHEVSVIAALDAANPGAVVHIGDQADAPTRTLEALRDRATIIVGGRIASLDGSLVGAPDVLVRFPSGYAPVEIKSHLVTRRNGIRTVATPLDAMGTAVRVHHHDEAGNEPDEDAPDPIRFRSNRVRDLYQVAHYWRILDDFGEACNRPLGGVIGTEDPLACAWVDLTDSRGNGHDTILDEAVAWTEQAVDALRRGDDHPEHPAIAPWWRSECSQCPWRLVCRSVLEEIGDPTMLSGVDADVRKALALDGVATVDDIAALDLADGRFVNATAVPQARAMVAGTLLRRAGVDPPLDVPQPARAVDFDIETFDNRIYLAGFLVSEDGQSTYDWIADWEWTDRSERSFVERLFAKLAAFSDRGTRVFHWTEYERTQLAAASARYGMSIPGFAMINDWFNEHATDLHRWTKNHFISPDGYSLKTVAPLCGFTWRDDDAGGQQSELWFEAMLGGDPSMQRRLLEYNEDDVAAQLAIRRWVVDNDDGSGSGSAIPSVNEVPVRRRRRPVP
ncbi:MAG: TM0106 family RecB-like putative nuclease [Acidimicrobiia bacterium]